MNDLICVAALLPLAPSAVGVARRLVSDVAQPYVAAEGLRDAELLTSELVSNALRHSESGRVRLQVSCGDGKLRVDVTDEAPPLELPSEPHMPGPDAESGRGLPLLALMAHRWGVSRAEGVGNQVWFELPARV